jgi:hypothetical protein
VSYLTQSPKACDELIDAIEAGMTMFDYGTDSLAGATDCPKGCTVEPDAHCVHGYLSAEETLLRTVA